MQGVQLVMDEENEFCFVSTINCRMSLYFTVFVFQSIEKYLLHGIPAES